MAHEEFAQLLALGNQEINVFIDTPRGKIHRPDQVLGGSGQIQLLFFAIERQHVKLPGLPAIEQAQTLLIHLLLFEIHDAGDLHVLLDPGIFDGAGIDAEETFGQIAKRADGDLLHGHDMADLFVGEHALLDQ